MIKPHQKKNCSLTHRSKLDPQLNFALVHHLSGEGEERG